MFFPQSRSRGSSKDKEFDPGSGGGGEAAAAGGGKAAAAGSGEMGRKSSRAEGSQPIHRPELRCGAVLGLVTGFGVFWRVLRSCVARGPKD